MAHSYGELSGQQHLLRIEHVDSISDRSRHSTAPVPDGDVAYKSRHLWDCPNVTTTVGCGSSCSGQLTSYMDGALFQNWSVASNGVDAPPIVNGPALTMGPHTLTVDYGGNAQYAPTTASLSFVVTQATHGTVPVVTWNKPAAVSYGTTLSSAQLNATWSARLLLYQWS